MKKKLLPLLFTIFLSFWIFNFSILLPLVVAQISTPFGESIISIAQHGMGMIIILLVAFLCLVIGILVSNKYTTFGKMLVIIGLVFLLIGITVVEIAYIVEKFFNKNPLPIAICRGVAGESENLFNKLICVFTGLEVKAEDWTSYLFLLVFAIIVPFGIICSLFYGFMPGILEPNIEKVLAVLFAIVAYRFLIASLFFELLSYGIAGLGILLFNVFIMAIVFKAVSKFWKAAEYVSTALKVQTWADLSRLMEERQNLIRARDEAVKEGDMKKVREFEKMLEKVEKEINKVRKKIR
jgi:MFS family permease